MRLSRTKTGDKLIITKINDGVSKRRLLDFGFTPGTSVEICNIAPFGGTMLLSLRGYTLALRESACDGVEVRLQESGKKRAQAKTAKNNHTANNVKKVKAGGYGKGI